MILPGIPWRNIWNPAIDLRSQSTKLDVNAFPIILKSKEAAYKEEQELGASCLGQSTAKPVLETESPSLWTFCDFFLFLRKGIVSTWARSWCLDQWAFHSFLCLVWLWFPFGSFLVCQGNQQCRIADQCSLEWNLGRLWNPKQSCLLFQSPFSFLSAIEEKRHLRRNYYFNTAAENCCFIRKILAMGK